MASSKGSNLGREKKDRITRLPDNNQSPDDSLGNEESSRQLPSLFPRFVEAFIKRRRGALKKLAGIDKPNPND